MTDATNDQVQPEEQNTEEVSAEETPTVEEATPEAPSEEVKEEAPAVEEPKVEEKPEPSGKFKELITTIEGLTALELAGLVKELEERFGVSAAAPVAFAGAAPAGAAGGEAAEEKSSYDVILTEAGANKIAAIKVVREITQLGLKEAKDLVEAAPKELKKDVKKEEAEEMKKKIEEAGAKAELK